MATKNATFDDTVEVYERRYGEQVMRTLDSTVRAIASKPLNPDEMNGYMKHIPSETPLSIAKAKDIIEARWRAGLYDELIESSPVDGSSIRRNLRSLGITPA